jgi:hypothetical protein
MNEGFSSFPFSSVNSEPNHSIITSSHVSVPIFSSAGPFHQKPIVVGGGGRVKSSDVQIARVCNSTLIRRALFQSHLCFKLRVKEYQRERQRNLLLMNMTIQMHEKAERKRKTLKINTNYTILPFY